MATQATTKSCGQASTVRSQSVFSLIQGGWTNVTAS
jgi:hypothetical protein